MACENKECHLWEQCQENTCVCEDNVIQYDWEDFNDGFP